VLQREALRIIPKAVRRSATSGQNSIATDAPRNHAELNFGNFAIEGGEFFWPQILPNLNDTGFPNPFAGGHLWST
jgi:hypothetical protein